MNIRPHSEVSTPRSKKIHIKEDPDAAEYTKSNRALETVVSSKTLKLFKTYFMYLGVLGTCRSVADFKEHAAAMHSCENITLWLNTQANLNKAQTLDTLHKFGAISKAIGCAALSENDVSKIWYSHERAMRMDHGAVEHEISDIESSDSEIEVDVKIEEDRVNGGVDDAESRSNQFNAECINEVESMSGQIIDAEAINLVKQTAYDPLDDFINASYDEVLEEGSILYQTLE